MTTPNENRTDAASLVERLWGVYRVPITDGLGPAGGEEPDNANEFVWTFPVPPIHKEAAEEITRLRALLEKARDGLGLKWVTRTDEHSHPTETGWYRVAISGDEERLDGHVLYSFGDYETFAFFTAAEAHEREDFPGGYQGNFDCVHDESDESIFAYCGPIVFPPRALHDEINEALK